MPTLNLGRVRFNWRGEYDALTSYLKYDVVKADGQSYVCIADVTGTGPLDAGGSTYWEGALLRGADYNQARDDAIAAADAASTSETNAATSESNAASSETNAGASEALADRWANEAVDVEVEPGKFSAYHWSKKAEAFGDPNEFNLTADLTSDTRRAREWMAQVLANQQAATDAQNTATSALSRSNHTGTQPLSTISDAGTAAAADVTTSATDTTSGRVMKVGDFGLGIKTQPDYPLSDLDADPTNVPSGIYRVTSGVTNRPDGYGGVAIITRYNSSAVNFLFIPNTVSSLAIYRRRFALVQWDGPWIKDYNQSNILGTVSQSGGVPTGAIIERGSNANGEYVKLADGRVEITTTVSCPYATAELLSDTFNYPINLASVTGGWASSDGMLGSAININRLDVSMLAIHLPSNQFTVRVLKLRDATNFPTNARLDSIRVLITGTWY